MEVLQVIGVFLVRIVFNLYIYILLIRFLLQLVGASYYDPISQLVVKLTNPLVKPLQRVIPRFHAIDLAILLLLFLFESLKIALLLLITGFFSPLLFLPLLVVIQLLKKLINIYLFAIILRAIISWVIPATQGHYQALFLLTEPLLKPVRRVIPPIKGYDISPVIAIIILSILSLLLWFPLAITGKTLYFIV